jgi:hypothetical protein
MADKPSDDESKQPDATNPHKVVPHRHIYDFAQSTKGPWKRGLTRTLVRVYSLQTAAPVTTS